MFNVVNFFYDESENRARFIKNILRKINNRKEKNVNSLFTHLINMTWSRI